MTMSSRRPGMASCVSVARAAPASEADVEGIVGSISGMRIEVRVALWLRWRVFLGRYEIFKRVGTPLV